MLGVGMMFTCHQCKPLNLKFASWDDLVLHRAQGHPSDFVHGVPFWMLEDRLFEHDYYWIARQTHDRAWLKWANSRRS